MCKFKPLIKELIHSYRASNAKHEIRQADMKMVSLAYRVKANPTQRY